MGNRRKIKKIALTSVMIAQLSTSYSSCPCCMAKKTINTSGLVKENKKRKDRDKEEQEEEKEEQEEEKEK